MSQRHGNYFGFVKIRVAKHNYCFCDFWRRLVDFGCHFGPHRISKGVPKSIIFETNHKKIIKKEVQETALKKHGWLIDF